MSIKKNFIYNVLYQLLAILLPLVTAPYISRTLGAHGLGVYSYTYAVVYNFSLFILLGVANYGNRSIATVRDHPRKRAKVFTEIYSLQLFVSVLVTAAYLVYFFKFQISDRNIAAIQIIYLLSAVLDISWFYFGIEQFKITVTRNALIKLLTVAAIFLFVKKPEDLWKYTLIMSLGFLGSQAYLWVFLHRYTKIVPVVFRGIIAHLVPNLVLFMPVVAVSVYKTVDKILLGSLSNMTQVGFYGNSENIINLPLSLITALGVVMLPRMSNLRAKGEIQRSRRYIALSMEFVILLASALTFGIAGIAPEFAPIFFGREFAVCGVLIPWLSPIILFISWANVIRTQYLIPNHRDKEYIVSVVIGAVVNVAVNLLLIPGTGAFGAVVGTVAAEASVAVYQTWIIRKELAFSQYLKSGLPFLAFGAVMYAVVRFIGTHMGVSIQTVLAEVLAGGAVFLLLSGAYMLFTKDKLLYKVLKG